jgi:hypothetical protein
MVEVNGEGGGDGIWTGRGVGLKKGVKMELEGKDFGGGGVESMLGRGGKRERGRRRWGGGRVVIEEGFGWPTFGSSAGPWKRLIRAADPAPVLLRRLAPARLARQGAARAQRERAFRLFAADRGQDPVLRARLRERHLPVLFRITPSCSRPNCPSASPSWATRRSIRHSCRWFRSTVRRTSPTATNSTWWFRHRRVRGRGSRSCRMQPPSSATRTTSGW